MSEASVADVIRGRTILLVGGSGFVGCALGRRLVALQPAVIRVLSRSEARHSQLARMLQGSGTPVEHITGDVADPYSVRRAIAGANVVFHLAAMKELDACESKPYEAIKTNVIGSKVILDAASQERSVSHFVAVSSVRAVNPIGVYGMTKSLMERIVCDMQLTDGPRFSVVRCGSFWGSSPEVLSIWLRSVREGRELLVTDARMSRFVILAREGADLILSAASRGLRGGILVPLMPVYILGDLAAAFAERYGTTARVVGPRAGEKLHDDLISATEAPFTRREGDEFIVKPGHAQEGAGPFSSQDAVRLTKEQILHLLDTEEVSAN